jgi:hypothetical protein
MADGFVAGKAEASVDVVCGADDAFFDSGVQGGSEDFAVPLSLSNPKEIGRPFARLAQNYRINSGKIH